jgi:hypothetical protein
MVRCFTRTATLFLILVLAGGPAVASACTGVCAPPSATAGSPASAAIHQHHQPHAPADHQHRTDPHAGAEHGNHQTIAATAASADSPLRRLLSQDCCRRIATPRVAVAASRIDRDLLPGSHAALHAAAAAMVRPGDRQSFGPAYGPPPGELSPVRVPLALRI